MIGSASPLQEGGPLRLGLFEHELKKALDLAVSFRSHDRPAKLVSLNTRY